jgi:spermidine/putrescine transport system ATP-binding protein
MGDDCATVAAMCKSLILPTSMSSVMVEMRGVSKRFGEHLAVDNIDLSVQTGEFLTLLGPSGCGKTTLLRMISGLELPSSGAVLLEGRDVTHDPPYERDVNQVFQSYALFPHLTVEKNVSFGLSVKKVPVAESKQRVSESISMVALAGLEKRMPHQLSGGQKQRVALARAIVNRPKVLLLDEPLGALDAKLRESMQIELKRLQRALGITFIFVTHDQSEALIMSDRIAVMNAGRIEQLGAGDEVYHRPATAFVAAFIGQANILDATVVGPALVKLSSGEELVLRSDSTTSNQRVRLSIRPEKVYLQNSRQSGQNVFQATVIEEHFRGAVDQLLIRTQAGLMLTAVVANEGASQATIHAGDTVFCQLHPDDLVMLK